MILIRCPQCLYIKNITVKSLAGSITQCEGTKKGPILQYEGTKKQHPFVLKTKMEIGLFDFAHSYINLQDLKKLKRQKITLNFGIFSRSYKIFI